jgi:hypothetical protein
MTDDGGGYDGGGADATLDMQGNVGGKLCRSNIQDILLLHIARPCLCTLLQLPSILMSALVNDCMADTMRTRSSCMADLQ